MYVVGFNIKEEWNTRKTNHIQMCNIVMEITQKMLQDVYQCVKELLYIFKEYVLKNLH